jgi:hypothetical protein
MLDLTQENKRGGWVENEDGTWSYLIRKAGNEYFRSQQTVSKKEAFKYILMGDKKGNDSE